MKINSVQINQNKQNSKKNNTNSKFCNYIYNYSFKAVPAKSASSTLEKFTRSYVSNMRYKASESINKILAEKQTLNVESMITYQMKGIIDNGLNEAVTYVIGRFFRSGASRIENYIGKESYRPYITDVFSIIGNKEELLFQIRNGKIEVINLLQTKHDLLKPEERNMLEFLSEPSKDNWTKLTLRQKANLGLHGILYER
jgi:hypothetical protein